MQLTLAAGAGCIFYIVITKCVVSRSCVVLKII